MMELKLWMVLLAWLIWVGIFITMWAVYKYNYKKLKEDYEKKILDLNNKKERQERIQRMLSQ